MRTLLYLLFLLASTSVCAQSTQDLEMLSEIIETPTKVDYSSFKIDSDNEVKIILTSLFLFYKNFISSQDSQRCSFHPSCSVYGIQSIQKKGILFGGLNSMDRLTRCNSLDKEKYPVHSETHLLYDPVN